MLSVFYQLNLYKCSMHQEKKKKKKKKKYRPITQYISKIYSKKLLI